jgi:uncharacterized protein YdhG (YjbR/CyaY superfamily)
VEEENMARPVSENIDSYIQEFPPEVAERLTQLRTAIREAAPDAVEKISWSMPTFWQKVNIAHFAAFKHHIGFYPGAEAIEAFQERLTPYKTSKGAVQLPEGQPLPLTLVQDMVRFNLARYAGAK